MILDEWNQKETYHQDTLPYSFRQVAQDLLYPVALTRLDIPRPLFTQSLTTGGKAKVIRHKADSKADLSVYSRTRQPPDHNDPPPKSEDQLYPESSNGGGGLLPMLVGESSVKTAPPRVGHIQGAYSPGRVSEDPSPLTRANKG